MGTSYRPVWENGSPSLCSCACEIKMKMVLIHCCVDDMQARNFFEWVTTSFAETSTLPHCDSTMTLVHSAKTLQLYLEQSHIAKQRNCLLGNANVRPTGPDLPLFCLRMCILRNWRWSINDSWITIMEVSGWFSHSRKSQDYSGGFSHIIYYAFISW